MASLNKVMIIGNLTRDPEVRYTPKGTAVTDIGVACNRVWSGDDGQKQEETTFVDVTLWGRVAEIAGQYLRKGRQIFVEGRLQLDQWEDKDSGQKRSKLKVVGENMQMLGKRSDNDDERRRTDMATKPPPSQDSSGDPFFADDDDDDVPF